jgi:pSer/pThr/pTyr-binding forkhead associated (FHA) protein/S1-C subfamily serine protease
MKRLMFPCMLVSMLALFQVPAVAQTSGPSVPPQSVPPLERVVAYAQPSIIYLHIEWTGWVYDTFNKKYLNNDEPFVLSSSCTGFVVNPDGYVATAGHCVDKGNITADFFDAAALWAFENGYYADKTLTIEQIRSDFAEANYRLEGSKEGVGGKGFKRGAELKVQAVWSTTSTESLYDDVSGELNGEPHDARLIKLLPWNEGEGGDTALLRVETAVLPPPLPVAPTDAATSLTRVISIGYPASVGDVSDTALSDPSFKEGRISSVRSNATFPVYELSASMSGGMSGGPTVDPQGRVVGINSYGPIDESGEFAVVQSSATLMEVLTDAGVSAELGEVGTAYRQGLDAYFAGNRTAAIRNLRDAIAANGELDMAQEYLTKAQALPIPEEGSSSILPIAAGTAVVLLLAGGGYFLMQRRKKASTPPSPVAGVEQRSPASTRVGTGSTSPNTGVAPDRLTEPAFSGVRGMALMVKNGPSTGRRISVDSQLEIGRENVDIVIEDSQMSRRHAAVRPYGSRLEIADLGSSNGTYVNGRKIEGKVSVSSGDSIRLGGTFLDVVGDRSRRTVMGGRPATVIGDVPDLFVLVVKDGPSSGRRIEVGSGNTIGHGSGDVDIDDVQISRRHAYVKRENGLLTITDLGSTNGTFINGRRIDGSAQLDVGDSIKMGQTSMEVEVGHRRTTAESGTQGV